LVRRAKLLARFGLAWHAVETAVAGLAASSIALTGLRADSMIESLAGLIARRHRGAYAREPAGKR
jgi:hypothetical protein